jgi:hypothetical protein
MSAALELIQTVEANGGYLRIDGEYLVIAPAEAAAPVMEELRQHKAEIIRLLQNRSEHEAEDPMDAFGPGLWLLARCTLDNRWGTSIGSLYLDFWGWRKEAGLPKPLPESFAQDIKEAGFQVEDGIVNGLVLKQDMEAHERFQTADNTSIESESSGGIVRD